MPHKHKMPDEPKHEGGEKPAKHEGGKEPAKQGGQQPQNPTRH